MAKKNKLDLNSHLSKVQFVCYSRLNVDKVITWSNQENCFYYSMHHLGEDANEKEHWHVAIRSKVGSKKLFRLSQINRECSVEGSEITANLFERLNGIDGFLLYVTHYLESKKYTYDFMECETNDFETLRSVSIAFDHECINEKAKKVDYLGACVQAIYDHEVIDLWSAYRWFEMIAKRHPTLAEVNYIKAFLFIGG